MFFLWLEIIKKIIGVIVLFVTLPYGLEIMLYAKLATSIIATFINAFPNTKILKYTIREQIFDLMLMMLMVAAMGGIVYATSLIPIHYVAVMVIEVLVGMISYLLLSMIFKPEAFLYCKDIIVKGIHKIKDRNDRNISHKDKTKEDNIEEIKGDKTKVKKILLLGGSAQQIVAINKAKELGYYTILCDYLSDNPGQNYADKFYLASTTDRDLILEIATHENIDGILAYASDPAAPTAAYVAEKLGLPTSPYRSVDILTDKGKFRKFLSENGFNTPRANDYTEYEDLVNEFNLFKLPVIIKPVDSSGSKGVSRVDSLDELKEKFDKAMSFSRGKRVIVEEYVEAYGYQIAGDGFSYNGRLVFRCFGNDHFDKKSKNPFVPVSASFPYCMPKEVHDIIHDTIQRLFTLLDMKTNCYNFDMRIDKDYNVYLMEVGPRDGGNYIPQLIKYSTGVDLVELACRAAVGEDCSDVKMVEQNGYYAYYSVHSYKAGILEKIEISEEGQKHIIENHILVHEGDNISEYIGSNTTLGILLMRFDNEEQMLDMMDNAEKWINVIVK